MPEHFRILVVDDERDIRAVVEQTLRRLPGFEVHQADGSQGALALLERHAFDLVLTDLAMEHPNAGVELLQGVKQRSPDTIVIVLTGYATVESAIAALRLGADDYLIKPVSVADLRGSVQRALQRRAARVHERKVLADIASTLQALSGEPGPVPLDAPAPAAAQRYIEVGALRLDLHTHQVMLGPDDLKLTATEFAVLRVLAQAGERVMTFEELIRSVQGVTYDREEARLLLRSHIRNLRRKLGPVAGYLHNVRGTGYYLSAE